MAAELYSSRHASDYEIVRATPGQIPIIRVTLPEYPAVVDHLTRKEWKPILRSPSLFWLLFCHAFTQQKRPPDSFFHIALQKSKIIVSGRARLIQQVENEVERIREVVQNAFSAGQGSVQQNFVIRIRNTMVHAVPETGGPVLDARGVAGNTLAFVIPEILPTLPPLFGELGITYSEAIVRRPVLFAGAEAPAEYDVQQITLTFDHLSDSFYAVPPIPIHWQSLPDTFYTQWKTGKFCDFTLVAQDGTRIPVQANILDALGGAAVQAWFKDGFKESKDKMISFPDTPASVLNAALEFFYKGPAGLSPEAVKELPLLDLYAFACRWQIADLITHCVNLLSLVSSSEDAPLIREAHERMPHPQLEKLLAHYESAPAAAGGAAAAAGGAGGAGRL